MASSDNLFANSVEYTFNFFLSTTSQDTDENLKVMFPMEFNLHLCDGADSYTCDTYLVDNLGVTEDWNTDESCTATGNWVELGA